MPAQEGIPDISSFPLPYFSVGQPPPAAPPRRIRPRRLAARNRPRLNLLSDLEVWDRPDQEILDAARAAWKSDVYNHYDLSLIRHTRTDPACRSQLASELPDYLEFAFTCKSDSARHPVQYRRRSETHRGTGNLKTSIEACRSRNCDPDILPSASTMPAFSYAMHLAIIVLMCAYHYLPFAGVLHDLVRRQVQLLRPGTTMPDSTTLARTTRLVYERQAERVRQYFRSIDTIHMAIDGWTSPTATAYLGLVVHWYSEGQIWRVVLEMIRLDQKHTGEYLAQKTAECLRRYGISDKLLVVCMDNASNNDTFTRHLPVLIPTFGGVQSRVRCAAHVANLLVKAFTDHFIVPARRKRKAIEAKSKSKSGRKRRRATGKSPANGEDDDEEVRVVVVDEEPGLDDMDSEDEGNDTGLPAGGVDEAKSLHNEFVIKEMTEAALGFAKSGMGLDISLSTRTHLQQIITKTAKISRKVHEKPELKHKFDALIDSCLSSLKTDRRALARRVPTRWNSDYECLESHRDLRICVEALAADKVNGIHDLRLDDDQWLVLDQIIRVLKIFKEITGIFSQAGVPLVHEVVPAFVRMRRKLQIVREGKSVASDLHPMIRVAAHSALLVLDKYANLFEESEVYWIALVMCPNYKLQWLRDNGFTQSNIDTVRNRVIHRFNTMFPAALATEGLQTRLRPCPGLSANSDAESEDEWNLQEFDSLGTQGVCGLDTIEEYLRTEPVSVATVQAAGGPLKHWESQIGDSARPRLARFAISYLSAPASSVEAERAFSCGRLTINHLQHNMSSDTFCAKMALRSWYQTPLMPSVDEVAALIGNE